MSKLKHIPSKIIPPKKREIDEKPVIRTGANETAVCGRCGETYHRLVPHVCQSY